MRIIRLNNGNRGVTEHHSLLARIDVWVDTGDILGMKSRIGTGDTGISLVRTNNIISKAS